MSTLKFKIVVSAQVNPPTGTLPYFAYSEVQGPIPAFNGGGNTPNEAITNLQLAILDQIKTLEASGITLTQQELEL